MKQLFTYILLALSFATANAEDWVVNAEPSILEVHYTRIEVTDTTRRDSRFLKEPVMLRIGKTMSLFCGTKNYGKTRSMPSIRLWNLNYIARLCRITARTGRTLFQEVITGHISIRTIPKAK